ncbi:unnamed protein product [Choristocarpus tenellus]
MLNVSKGDHKDSWWKCTSKSWELVKISVALHLKGVGHVERAWLEHPLWFLFSCAKTRAAKARHRRQILPAEFFKYICQQYCHAVRDLVAASYSADQNRCSVNNLPKVKAFHLSGDARFLRVPHPPPGWNTLKSEGKGQTNVERGWVDAVLTSPPYPGVYDYLGYARSVRALLGELPMVLEDGHEDSVGGTGKRVSMLKDGNGDMDSQCALEGKPRIRHQPLQLDHTERALDTSLCVGPRAGAEIFGTGWQGLSHCRGEKTFLTTEVPAGRDWPDMWREGEMGGKSSFQKQRKTSCSPGAMDYAGRWAEDQRAWLGATALALRPGGGRMAVMIGDGGGIDTLNSLLEAVDALDRSGEVGLRILGSATLRGGGGARRKMRTEHLVLFERA